MSCSSERPSRSSLVNDQLIPGPGDQQGLIELGAPGELARGLVDEHLLAVGRGQGVVLGFGVLVGSRFACCAVWGPRSNVYRKRWHGHGLRYTADLRKRSSLRGVSRTIVAVHELTSPACELGSGPALRLTHPTRFRDRHRWAPIYRPTFLGPPRQDRSAKAKGSCLT